MQLPPARRPSNFLARLRPDRVALLLAALAILGAGLILTRQVNHGVGVSTDSLAYAIAAKDIAAGNNPALPNSAPLFPAALALPSALGFDPISAAALLNAAAFGMTIFFSTLWLWRKTRSLFIVVWASAALIVAPPLIHVTPWALSEPLFILLTMSALLTLDAFIENRRRSLLLLAVAFAALAFLTRYLGAAMVLTGAMLLLLQRNVPFSQRAKEASFYAAAASIPTCAWLFRNFLEIGSITGHSAFPPFGSLSQNIEAAAAELWKIPFAWSDLSYAVGRRVSFYADDIVPAIIAAAALAAAGVVAGAAMLRATAHGETGPSRNFAPAFLMALFACAYVTTAVIGVTTTSRSEGFGVRYFAPAYPPIVLAVALIANACFRSVAWRLNVPRLMISLAPALGAILLSLWLLPQASLYAEQYRLALGRPLGHDVRSWRNSPATLEIQAKSLAGRAVVGTNSLDIAPYLTGVREFRFLPCTTANDARNWLARAGDQDKEVYVVWFDGFIDPIGCEAVPPSIRTVARMESVARLPNGNIFRVSPPSANPLEPYRDFYASFASLEPIASSKFDIHASSRTLAYLRESCAPSDAHARFFLHVFPLDETDLLRERRRSGFNNFDFSFEMDGAHFDGKCLTTAILPDYPIARIRTGQFVRGGSKIWEEAFRLPP